jgi:chemotaxis protein MotB
MFRSENANEESNFWISYADLMAGLLFVFILLIGAIVSKSIILKSDLHDKEDRLSAISKSLKEKENRLEEVRDTLAKSKALIGEKDSYLSQNKALLALKDSQLTEDERKLKIKDDTIGKNERLLKLRMDEIAKLNKMLIEAQNHESELSNKIVIVQNVLSKNEDDLKKTKEELDKEKKTLKDYEGKVLVLSNQLTDAKDAVKLKDEKLLAVLNAMDEKKTKYDELLANLQSQKAKIKSLTGIKLKVVAALKEALGNKIDIDKKTGSLRLASNILFGSGEATLKPEAKVELKKAFEDYIGTLVTNKEIKPHLDKIIIEGHTDSDGSYIYNLNLSQKRALAVMEYLLTLDFTKKYNIRPLMTASGRAYLDHIVKNGVEDKEASRRIEIKFRLKNEDAMNEIEKVLDAK